MAQIHELISKVAADIGVVGKSKRNAAQGYNFRSIDDVIDACHSALVKHGVTILPVVTDMKREERSGKTGGTIQTTVLTVKYVFTAPDGSSLDAIVIGEGMDSGDKSANKAMSAAYKYATGQVFAIPFSMDDSENDSPQPGKAKQQEKAPAKPTVKPPEQKPPQTPQDAPPKPPEGKTSTEQPKNPPSPPNAKAEQSAGDVAAEIAKIRKLASECGLKTADEFAGVVSGLIGRPVSKTTDLNAAERKTAIEGLEKMKGVLNEQEKII